MSIKDKKFRAWSGGKFIFGTLEQFIWSMGQQCAEDVPLTEEIGEELAAFQDTETEKTITEYTGVKDKNGKELYFNSDIVKLDDRYGVFVAMKDDFGIPIFVLDNNVMAGQITFEAHFLISLISRRDAFEIIGNIYENPELIK